MNILRLTAVQFVRFPLLFHLFHRTLTYLLTYRTAASIDAVSQELRDVHSDLTEDDIATLATARLAEEQPRDRMWYRINAVKVLGGKSKLQPTVNARLATVCHTLHASQWK